MKSIKRYDFELHKGVGQAVDGRFVTFEDVEVLQKELEDTRAKAIAAVWLMREDVGIHDLEELREEAREVFLGKDKQTIAKLQDELRRTQEYLRYAQSPPRPGVNSVHGVKAGEDGKTSYALMITKLHHGPNGGLEVEVQIP